MVQEFASLLSKIYVMLCQVKMSIWIVNLFKFGTEGSLLDLFIVVVVNESKTPYSDWKKVQQWKEF